MREIKYKAWDKKTKKIRDVVSISFHHENTPCDYEDSHLPKVVAMIGYDVIEQKHYQIIRDIKDVVLMQYADLKDKNKKEIYEDYILKDQYGNVGLCRFIATSFEFINTSGFLEDGSEWEIIGNKYENPELLEN